MLDLVLSLLMIILVVYSFFVVRKWHKVGIEYDRLADELKKEVVTVEED